MSAAFTSAGESPERPFVLADTNLGLAVDELTGFLTRQSLTKLMKSEAFRAAWPHVALVKVELSRFDLMGIGKGPEHADLVIVRTSQRLARLLGSALAFARMGEARFCALLVQSPTLEADIRRMMDFLQRPMAIDGEIIVVRPHVGVALMDDVDRSETRLIQAASAALHHARIVNHPIMFFQPAMLAEARRNHQLENDLRLAITLKSTDIYDAVNNAEFSILYQPIVNEVSGCVHGFEALVRWQHPTFGLVSPQHFIDLAEQIGVMPLLGNWIIRRAMVDAMAWPANRDGTHPRVSINLSARQFDEPELLLTVIKQAISHAGIQPSRVCFEMTESNYLSPAVKPHLEAIRAIGCFLALDDFGTGYSALSVLVELPLDYLKIDRSLVVDLAATDARVARRSRRLMSSIIGLAEGLGLHPVIEGVENREQLLTVCAMGAELIQGYIHHPPMPMSAVARFMETITAAGPAGE
ncbi:hypothetical protein CAP39_13325 [Sphingomonas sp. IBVSS1]|nr:hypothetical protein CAP39_13325 [Sphingomonas sp. IBVSS1]